MKVKRVIAFFLGAVLLFSVVCVKDEEPSDPDITTTTDAIFGVFQILNDQDKNFISFNGAVFDGPIILEPQDTVMKSGVLLLLKPAKPYCECEYGYQCVKDDSCVKKSNLIDVGDVTVSGLKLLDGAESFTSKPIGSAYSTGTKFMDPPYSAGDIVTVSVAGKDSVPAFTITGTGIDTLKILNDTLKLIDGQDVDLAWVPAKVPGKSRIIFEINISYHATTKATIVGNCEDNGTIKIPGTMLDKLKTFGIAGYPKIKIARRSEGAFSSTGKVRVETETYTEVYFYDPDLRSCSSDGECPDGQHCKQPDRICE